MFVLYCLVKNHANVLQITEFRLAWSEGKESVDFLHDTSSNFDFKTDTALCVTIQYIQIVVSKCTPKSKWVKYESTKFTTYKTIYTATYIYTYILCNAHFYTTLYNQFPQPSNYQI